MPWPPSEGNADIWEQWIKDYHASSAFNVCQHQIRVKEGSQIVVLHQPIPLPHIWCQKVLEWDCRLGLIWRVPAGMPTITIWCSKMVVTAEGEDC